MAFRTVQRHEANLKGAETKRLDRRAREERAHLKCIDKDKITILASCEHQWAKENYSGIVQSLRVGNRHLTVGDVLTFQGFGEAEFEFRSARLKDGECLWLTVFGGRANRSMWRHFSPQRITSKKRKPAGVR